MSRIPSYLDRYPAKMVSRLADRLLDKYVGEVPSGRRLMDPFCGSGAILEAAANRGMHVAGVDINPFAALLTSMKLRGFDTTKVVDLAESLISESSKCAVSMPMHWTNKKYWFTPRTLDKIERLRAGAHRLELGSTDDGRAVLLATALSMRLCSRADQRSPKPFISSRARATRKGKHFDPFRVLPRLVQELRTYYSGRGKSGEERSISTLDFSSSLEGTESDRLGRFDYIMTSPPYINAQDYFRNSKLELYFLEGLLPFRVGVIRNRFIGTERGGLLDNITQEDIDWVQRLFPDLCLVGLRSMRLESVVIRYFCDMSRAFENVAKCLADNGHMVLVCGDNLIGGVHIGTWKILCKMLEIQGFRMFDSFHDKIENRLLAPKRQGHKGLIKEEVVCAFRKDRR